MRQPSEHCQWRSGSVSTEVGLWSQVPNLTIVLCVVLWEGEMVPTVWFVDVVQQTNFCGTDKGRGVESVYSSVTVWFTPSLCPSEVCTGTGQTECPSSSLQRFLATVIDSNSKFGSGCPTQASTNVVVSSTSARRHNQVITRPVPKNLHEVNIETRDYLFITKNTL